ncbi:uncharacterized protein BX664DRAFT_326270 [Halteromyces radiatus]|uniref:uncharacterized protein n=1 Tax=Halteromyces radiatus TaxID=101107 RepID=UPI00221EE1BF|nr:uncharacterized protein BX664DRAFT_326270 [Halteromyces radiatus]KAI8097394.1 hypothetical protein BX664DRAFT_326270 [Halteromyces radiatus]
MTDNAVLSGSLRLTKGLNWAGKQDLETLFLARHSTDSISCGTFSVAFYVETIIPLHAVKLYTLTSQRYRAMTNSSTLCNYLTHVFKPVSTFHQPKYALLLRIQKNGEDTSNPFDESEILYPLPKISYALLYAQQLEQSNDNDQNSLHVYAQVIRDPFDYINFSNFTSINTTPKEDTYINTANSILQHYRPNLSLHLRNKLQYTQHHRQCWRSILKKDMDRLDRMDQIREESRLSRPERTLTITKRKLLPQRKSSNIAPPPQPQSIKRSQSASSSLSYTSSYSRKPTATSSSSSINNLDINPTIATSNIPSSQQSNSDSTYHADNKKQLKIAIWSKLLNCGHDKKAEDTKLLYQSIYQSIQFVTRKTFKDELLDRHFMELLIDKHIQFYNSLDVDIESVDTNIL